VTRQIVSLTVGWFISAISYVHVDGFYNVFEHCQPVYCHFVSVGMCST